MRGVSCMMLFVDVVLLNIKKRRFPSFCFGSLQYVDKPYQRIGKAGRKSARPNVLQCRFNARNVQCHNVWRAWCFVSARFWILLVRGCLVVVLCLRACLCNFLGRAYIVTSCFSEFRHELVSKLNLGGSRVDFD